MSLDEKNGSMSDLFKPFKWIPCFRVANSFNMVKIESNGSLKGKCWHFCFFSKIIKRTVWEGLIVTNLNLRIQKNSQFT